jgi:hypothetical protein
MALFGAGPTRAASTFTATASGEILRVGFNLSPGILAEQLADPGASVAQAQLDSIGTSTAFAANPFPGTLALAAPGTLAGAAGTPSLPDYPALANSSYPASPEDTVSQGTLELHAKSTETTSESVATDGANRTSVKVSVDPVADAVTAHAEAVVAGVSQGGAIDMSGVRSEATVTREPGKGLQRSSEFTVARLAVAGQTFAIGPDGPQLPGQALPVGIGSADAVLQPLLEQLAGQGVVVTFLKPIETEDGIVSGGMALTYRTALPNGSVITTTETYGRTSASVSNKVLGVEPVPDVTGDLGGDTLAPVGANGAAQVLGDSGLGSSGVTGGSTGTPGAISPSAASVAASAGLPQTSLARFYPVLFIVCCLLVLVTSLFRHFGVKLAWTS